MHSDNFFKDSELPYFECRYSRESSGEFKPHLHRRFSIGAVAEGSVLFNHLGEEITLTPGTLALINPETIHSCNSSHVSGRSYYMLYLDADWCRALRQTDIAATTFVPVSKCCVTDRSLFEQFCETMDTLMDHHIFLLEKEQLVTELVRAVFEAVDGTGSSAANDDISETAVDVARVKTLLAGNLRREINLTDISTQLEVNPYTLIRRFKAATGTTPHAYRLNCRIEHARHLLQAGCDIADTAYECGFFDQSHLHRHFRAMTTVTPQQYKKNFSI